MRQLVNKYNASLCRNTFRNALLMLVACCLLLPEAVAQNANRKIKVTGTVFDEEGLPMIGATIREATTHVGTLTDLNGWYEILVPANGTLEVSFIGYEKKRINVTGREKINVKLLPDKKTALDEVVVIGYGAVKKADLTGSVSNVKMGDIQDAPVLSIDQALQGRIAGADIMSTTGEPGATTSIRIRGTRSISASNEPLIVVDGVMDAVHDLNDLNTADIESISVLKDASSTAIYGSKGSNGVIIITTKKGLSNADKPSISFKTDIGFSKIPQKLDIMNASELAQYRNDYAYFNTADGNDEITDGTPLSSYPYSDPFSLGEGTDWVNTIGRTAMYQNYALSLSGGTKKTSYYVSLSYNNTEGVIRRSGQERITGRVSLTHQLFNWMKVGYTGNYTWRHNAENLASIGGTGWWNSAIYLSPTIKPMDDYNPFYYSGQKINTPLATILLNTNYQVRHSTNHTGFIEIEPIKNLRFKSQFTYYMYQRHTYRYYPSTLPAKVEGEGGEAYRAEYDDHNLLTENTLSYLKTLDSGHTFDGLLGFTGQRLSSNDFSLNGKGYMDDNVKWNNMNAVQDKQTYSASSSTSKRTKMSLLARFNYNYKQRYYLTVTGRYDGASNFAANNKWGFFPSAALKWNAAKEEFMKGVDWVNEMAIRVSAGRTGNDAISTYRSLAALSSTTNGYLFGGSQPAAYYPSRLASPNLTWEKTDLYNLGIDLAFLNNRLFVTAEAYISKTRDLLLTLQTPTQTGYSSRLTNIGKTSNKGIELTIESRNIEKPKFSWSTTFTIAHNEQNVDDIGTEDFVKAYGAPGNNSYMMYGYVKGYPLNALWGFKYGGVWKNQDEVNRNKATFAYASPSTTSNGSVRYYDINHDGTLSQDDLVYLGNADPWIYGGLQNTFRFGNLKVGIYFNYSLGGKIYNYAELYMSGSTFTNQYRYMLDSWHPVRNPNSDLPRAGSIDTHVPSDLQIHDATFLRLKSISIGYTFNLYKKTKCIRDLTLSVNGENLYLWKKYNGFDPDVSTSGDSTLRRMDLGAYPKPRTITFSAQIRY